MRVCAPQSRLAISIWGPETVCEQRVLFQAFRKILPSALPSASPLDRSKPG